MILQSAAFPAVSSLPLHYLSAQASAGLLLLLQSPARRAVVLLRQVIPELSNPLNYGLPIVQDALLVTAGGDDHLQRHYQFLRLLGTGIGCGHAALPLLPRASAAGPQSLMLLWLR